MEPLDHARPFPLSSPERCAPHFLDCRVLRFADSTDGDWCRTDGKRMTVRGPASLFLHISSGLTVIGILVLRLFWRLADPPPIESAILGAWLDRPGRLTDYALYALPRAMVL